MRRIINKLLIRVIYFIFKEKTPKHVQFSSFLHNFSSESQVSVYVTETAIDVEYQYHSYFYL
jgi:hypothetical protein